MPIIHVNQLGYYANEVKQAIIISPSGKTKLIDAQTKKAVMKIKESERKKSASADEYVSILDFSKIRQKGVYYLQNSGTNSYPFEIGDDIYVRVTRDVLEMYKYQLCGERLETADFTHEACHTALAKVYGKDSMIDVRGGWHVSGDYGRYVVPAVKAVTDLLLSYKFGRGIGYILEVVRPELEWLLKMQEESGGVYHKVSCLTQPGIILPEDETDDLIVSPVSEAATANFAGVMALASDLYRADEEQFANEMFAAAEKAWKWVETHPNMPPYVNPPEIRTTTYSDTYSSKDEKYFAACSLYHITGEKKYHDYIKRNEVEIGFGWSDMGYYGTVLYYSCAHEKDEKKLEQMKTSIIDHVRQIMRFCNEEPYMVSLKNFDLGSNMEIANNAMLLILTYELIEKNENYLLAAQNHLHYLLGRNALSTCFITGYGSNPPQNPHHRFCGCINKIIPGMVVGGPCSGQKDAVAAAKLGGKPPAKSYVDEFHSYSTNETAIHWNSPVYFTLSYYANKV